MIKNIDLSTMTREELEAYATKLTTEKEVLSAKLNWYEEQYKLSRSKLFGASSEQTPFDQLSFFNEAEFEVSGKLIPEVSIEDIKPPAKKKKGRKAEITNNLPTTVVEYTLTGDDLNDYQQGRSGDHAVNFLKGFKGFLHTDGYAGYHKLSKTKDGSPADVIQVGCFSHARRKWMEALMSITEKKDLMQLI